MPVFIELHLLLSNGQSNVGRFITLFLAVAGVMYIIYTTAHFYLANYADCASTFQALVAIPSVYREMSFTIWLLVNGGQR